MMYANFGEFINQKRVEKQITLRKMADMLGVSAPFLTDVEKDRRNPFDMEKLSQLAKILDLSEKGIGLKLNEELDLQCEETIKLDLKGSIFICKISRINKDLLGLSFNKVTPYQMKLIMSIFTENMQPYYKIAKSQEYIVNKKEVAEVAMVS